MTERDLQLRNRAWTVCALLCAAFWYWVLS